MMYVGEVCCYLLLLFCAHLPYLSLFISVCHCGTGVWWERSGLLLSLVFACIILTSDYMGCEGRGNALYYYCGVTGKRRILLDY
ncbi:uncharacterized protein BO88DRAFT_245635 [Aspergillus vadensis CBS 113365]|uniref:Uncharacterized protein n=1 Tax=Aspergillus vadensis (strain CBS 113365 / IMI 142717 / IBT 24658) TaxID=1448311 RepID=A0A319BEJ8_ASPVC|nr:hypothetical protein BO88DRAFT_245635 [Aspergillus vadensis CBS 113365]PYH71155.1 hypothetical protein BO88DRAFT_245635 [Aspergillus vadensis CBS 113365]